MSAEPVVPGEPDEMLDYYGVPRCGDVAHRINELGQMYRRAMSHPALPAPPDPRPSEAAIEAAAWRMWSIGNARLGKNREWEGGLGEMYRAEASQVLRVAYQADADRWVRPALPAPPDPAKFSERPFAEAVARVALLAMERTGMDLIGKYSREPVYPEAFVAAVADMWVRGRPKVGPALPAPEPPPYPRGWQTCPLCFGRGMVTFNPVTPTSTYSADAGPWTCPACNGQRVLPVDLHGGAALPAEHAPPDPSREALQAARDCLVTFYFDQPGNQLEAWAGHPHDDELVDALKAAYAVDFGGSRPALAGSPAVAFSRAEALILAFERAVRDVALDGGPESLENRERARHELYAAVRAALSGDQGAKP